MIGDPACDTLMSELEGVSAGEFHRHLSALMDGTEAAERAPEAMRRFFRGIEPRPDWFSSKDVLPGCRLFHRQSELFLTAFVASVIVRGFTTLIALSFFESGRILEQGVRRLRQNLRHLLEIMMPGGLEPQADGWKLSLRIRLVHARMRKLFQDGDAWDTAAHGLPLHAASMGFASAGFSAMLLQDATKIGVRGSPEERASFMHIWRCSAWLFGVPEAILFRDEADAREISRVGLACEPAFQEEGVLMAHTIINSAPLVAGITDEVERAKTIQLGYRLARALLGDEIADGLMFPRLSTFGFLFYLRTLHRLQEVLERLPFRKHSARAARFGRLLDITVLEEGDHGGEYRLPDNYVAELANKW